MGPRRTHRLSTLRRMSDTSSSGLHLAAYAIGSGVATALLPPGRMPTPARRAFHGALGLAAGGTTLWMLGRPELGETGGEVAEPLPLPLRAAAASAVGGLVVLSSVAGTAVDTRAEQAFARRGAKHPRLWVGVAAAVLTAATGLLERRRPSGPEGRGGSR